MQGQKQTSGLENEQRLGSLKTVCKWKVRHENALGGIAQEISENLRKSHDSSDS